MTTTDNAVYHDDGHGYGQHSQGHGQDEPGHEAGGRPQDHAAVWEGEHADGNGGRAEYGKTLPYMAGSTIVNVNMVEREIDRQVVGILKENMAEKLHNIAGFTLAMCSRWYTYVCMYIE